VAYEHFCRAIRSASARPWGISSWSAFKEVTKYGRIFGVDFGPVDIVRFAEAFGAKGLRIETPDQISSTIKKVLAMHGPVTAGVPVGYRDNHQFMETVHPGALN
jgi:acetolactate synthase-1/2/3 large subunit